MNVNPYASPAAVASPAEAEKGIGLFTPSQIAGATFLASPLAGAALMSLNHLRKDRAGDAVGTLLGGLIGTLMLALFSIVILPLLPFVPPILVVIVNTVLMKLIAQDTQGAEVDAHVAGGGSIGSFLEAIAVAVVSLAVTFGTIFGLVYLMQ